MALDPSLRVLAVDDDEDMILVVVALLRRLGLTDVSEAADGAAALDRLKREPFDVVVSDWNMEPVSGIELLREIRADDRLKDLPVLLATAEDTDAKAAAARAAGASGYLVKPFDAETLRRGLEDALDT